MFDRLAAYIALMSVTGISGTVLIGGLAMGFANWQLFVIAALFGLLGLPLAIYLSWLIRDSDPNWPVDRPAGGNLL